MKAEKILASTGVVSPVYGETFKTNALITLGQQLLQTGYRFTTVTPATHQLVNARIGNEWSLSIADIFGWSRPFKVTDIDSPNFSEIFDLMQEAGILLSFKDGYRSALRASTLDRNLYFHSAYPTTEADSVFFGPDTYRFVRALKSDLTASLAVQRAVDIGCGAGPGALTIAGLYRQAEVFAVDINDAALQITAVNAELAEMSNVVTCQSNLLAGVSGKFDLIVSNPPYLVDPGQRTYRNGGGTLGADLSLKILDAALERLAPNGTLLMYTGAPMIGGRDFLLQEVERTLTHRPDCVWRYEELDPDIFGEELAEDSYKDCDRIAAVWLKVTKVIQS